MLSTQHSAIGFTNCQTSIVEIGANSGDYYFLDKGDTGNMLGRQTSDGGNKWVKGINFSVGNKGMKLAHDESFIVISRLSNNATIGKFLYGRANIVLNYSFYLEIN